MTTGSHLPDLCAGMIIANRFQLERLLGQGGMGSVWVAQHLTLHIPVAVKFVDPTLGAREEVRSRFAQEAQSAAKINSPHVVRMVDYGTDEYGRPYIAMELLHGEELARRLEREPMMGLRDVSRLLSQAAKGLTKAHQAGITHRDLKPENIFLTEEDDGFSVKILDFGIAKADSPIGGFSHRTGTGQIVGTPTYMSPEQALGTGQIDFRSDLYSLAVVAYRCVTGRPPFESSGLGELIVAITSRPPTPPSALRREATPAIDAWFARGMAKSPAERFSSAKELADSFIIACGFSTISGAFSSPSAASSGSAQTSSGYAAASAVGGSGQKPSTLLSSASTQDDEPAIVPKRSALPLVLGGVLVLGAVIGGAAWMKSSSAPAPKPGAELSETRPLDSSVAPPPAPTPTPTQPIVVAPPPTSAPPPSASVPPPTGSVKIKLGKGDKPPHADDKPPPVKPPAPPPGPKDYGL